ncbi:Trimeric intracellular cation channel type 1B.1 [Eumeta japonica]|uniref:Trimeric intracellular cation channel type 1B.1 n=1 Tax=Eumeta variegata TaxID=151549 RepID=A0A4C1U8I5_EUMVA|nr:Trimeric intracellular cation channel type 1B.1 [Eumeta japonica]
MISHQIKQPSEHLKPSAPDRLRRGGSSFKDRINKRHSNDGSPQGVTLERDISFSIAKRYNCPALFALKMERALKCAVLIRPRIPRPQVNSLVVCDVSRGTLKGNGAGFTKLIERLIRGAWTPTAMETMQPSFYTKASLVASIIFVLDKKTDLISAPHALVYFGIVIFFVYFKLSSILLGIHDPFVPFENLFCALFMGGIWDSLAKLLGKGQPKEETKDTKKTN